MPSNSISTCTNFEHAAYFCVRFLPIYFGRLFCDILRCPIFSLSFSSNLRNSEIYSLLIVTLSPFRSQSVFDVQGVWVIPKNATGRSGPPSAEVENFIFYMFELRPLRKQKIFRCGSCLNLADFFKANTAVSA